MRNRVIILGALAICAFFIFEKSAHAAESRAPEIKIMTTDGAPVRSFLAFPENYTGGMSVTAGDLGGDGVSEIVVGSGLGVAPLVKIFRQDGSLITSFLAYAPTFGRGIRVAVGDVDGDGIQEIVTTPAYGGGPHVRVFDGLGNLKSEFFAYNPAFRGGVFVAVGDLDHDGRAEIVTGAGPSGGPHVRVFDGTGNLKSEFFALDARDTSGVTVGVGNVAWSGTPGILVGRASSDPPQVAIFSATGAPVSASFRYDKTFPGGVTSQGIEIDGFDHIVTTPNGNSAPILIYKRNGEIISEFMPFEDDFTGSVTLAVLKPSTESKTQLIIAPGRAYREGPIDLPQSIVVDISEQRLYAYEHGLLRESFLISSGLPRYATPTGTFSVTDKIPIMDYQWSYGPNHPENYFLPNVKYNLRFKPHFYLHYAYWHNNFGRVMSHGCVNMPLAQSEWIYNWADVGTPVTIQK